MNNKRLQDIVSEVQFELVKTEKRTPGVIDDPESFWKQKNTTTIASVPSYWDLLLITMKREWQFGSKLSNLEGALVGTETGNREPFALSQLEQRPVVPTSAPRTWNNHLKQPPKVKYIELLLINDYARWQQFGGHLIDLELNTLAIVSAAQHVFDRALFQGFRIRLVVHTILNEEKEERFCGDDRVTVSANRLLESFCDWHSTQDAGIRPVWDNAHLLSGRLFLGSEESKNWSDKETKAAPDLDAGNTIEGLSYVRGMCTASSSCSVVRASVYQEVRNIGLVLAHEIAHNLDAIHDGPDNGCPPYGHVMQATSCAFCQDLADSWSSCSIAAIGAFLNSDASQCLDNIPSLCGNGILDPGEACDSGMPNGSACCTPICQLKSGATCEDRNGSCCQNCTLLNAGTPCLSQQQEQGTLLSRQKLICQHPATCDGIHAACPILPLPQGSPCTLYPSDDVLLHTGQYPTVSLSPARRPDEPIQGVCLDGQCRTRERVCQQLGLSYSPKCDPLQSCSVICLEPNNKSKRQQTTNLSSNSTLTLAYATGGHCVAVSVQQLTGTTGPLAVPDFLSCKLDGRQPLNLGGHQFQSGLGVCHAGLCRPSDSPINTAESKPTHSQLQRITLLILIFLLFALVII